MEEHLDATRERFRINFSWLVKLRWAAAGGQLVTVAVVHFVLAIPLPLAPLLTLISALAVTNAFATAWFRRRDRGGGGHDRRRTESGGPRVGEPLMGEIMVLDILLLTGMLALSGGPANPFGVFYLVNLTLSCVLLNAVWAWIVTGLTLLCFVITYVWHLPLASPERHLEGTLVALSVAAAIIAYFIIRVTSELSRREVELTGARQHRAQTEKIEALATLAAGAAHELASPLSTIAVVARDLELELEKSRPTAEAVEDSKLIRREVARCRAILDQMSLTAGESAGEELARVPARELLEGALSGLREPERVTTLFDGPGVDDSHVFAPRKALIRSLRAVIKNALDACESSQRVDVVVTKLDEHRLRVAVQDHGPGMSPEVEARAAEPFFTTKEPGSGMGLGLFISRRVVERLGGRLTLKSTPGRGVTAELVLPVGGREDGNETRR